MKNYFKIIEHHESLEIARFSFSEMLDINYSKFNGKRIKIWWQVSTSKHAATVKASE